MSSSMRNPTPTNSFRRLQLRQQPRRPSQAQVLGNSIRWLLASRGAQSARFMTTRKVKSQIHSLMDSNIVPGSPEPPSSNFPHWVSWILGTIFSVILPALRLKGGFLQLLGKKVDEVVDVVEDVVEAAEDVAEVVDDVADAVHKVSSDLADALPDNSALKGVATWVENAAKEVSDGAEQTLDFIDKVEDFKEEVEKKVDQVLDPVDDDSNEEKAVGLNKETAVQPLQKDEEHVKEEAATR